ncbi:DNA repair protein Nse1 [Myriangium duriaei CBS 260.36]|uniref:Non-structural maintenance of chromosomes element 1 homolog n=1 Tax=Myriangium duriaei CBS 260.36 TaxID=1168546 RepID=A0A9P4IPQ7_9PEZI|nr:DNA repair protein Nse1 [Myriangium duriaei CBS 260.36]
MATYDNTHRAFLQVFFSRPTLTFAEAQPILAAIQTASDPDPERETLPNDVTQADFNTYIAALNNAISPFDMEIRSTLPQESSADPPPTRVWGLVNTTSDAISQLATTHTPDEIGFVKRVLDAMFETNNTRRTEVLAVTSMQALALSRPQQQSNGESSTQSAQQGLTKTEAERCLESLVAEGWLCLSRKGYYRLSTKALLELRSWLVETYNLPPEEGDEEGTTGVEKVKSCTGCGEIVVVGQRCGDLNCSVRVHEHCLRNVFRAAGRESCPTCKRDWTSDTFVGERAAQGRRSTGGLRNSIVTNGVDSDEG